MNTVYKEKIATYYVITAVLLITCIIFLIIIGSQFTEKALPMDNVSKAVLIIVFLLNLMVLVSFRELSVTVTEKQLILGYGRFRKKFYLANLESVELSQYKFSNYLGYGIRFGRDRTIGYAARGGPGLKVKFNNEKRKYFFNTARAEELKALLEQSKE